MVQMIEYKEMKVSKAAKDFNIYKELIYRWIKDYSVHG